MNDDAILNRKVLVAQLLTDAQVCEEFRKLKEGNATKKGIEHWFPFRTAITQHLMAGGNLTPEQRDDFDFVDFKLDDWASD